MSNYHIDTKNSHRPRTIDAHTQTVIEESSPAKKERMPAIMLALAVLYTISPIDLIPDIPIIGWVDDATFLIAAIMNYLEKSGNVNNPFYSTHGPKTAAMLRKAKWIVLGVGAIACILILVAGVTVLNVIF